MKTVPSLNRSYKRALGNPPVPPAIHWHPVAATEYLMPYETVARAIFIKANGLPAYYEATGLRRHPAGNA